MDISYEKWSDAYLPAGPPEPDFDDVLMMNGNNGNGNGTTAEDSSSRDSKEELYYIKGPYHGPVESYADPVSGEWVDVEYQPADLSKGIVRPGVWVESEWAQAVDESGKKIATKKVLKDWSEFTTLI